MRTLATWLGVIGTVAASGGGPATVAMSQYDYGRTGANLQESILKPVSYTHLTLPTIYSV